MRLCHTAGMDARLAAQLADRKAERSRRPRPLPRDTPDDPPVPWQPLAPGELQRTLAGSDAEYGATVRQATRRAAAATDPAPTDLSIRGTARRLLAQSIHRLGDIVDDSRSSAADITSAVRELAKIAGLEAEQPAPPPMDPAAVMAQLAAMESGTGLFSRLGMRIEQTTTSVTVAAEQAPTVLTHEQ